MIKIKSAAYHRNGVGGAPFYAVLFTDSEEKGKNFIASYFEERYTISVYCVEELSKFNIDFANGNSWRGDIYYDTLREPVEKFLKHKLWE